MLTVIKSPGDHNNCNGKNSTGFQHRHYMTSNSDSFYIMMNRRFGDFPNDGLILLTNAI